METGRGSLFERRVKHWYDKDHETPLERVAELAAILAVSLMTLYFIYSQLLRTGFFTPSFGSTEIFLFYAPVPLGIAVSVIRMVTGRRNPARPLETLNAITMAAAGLWLLIVFPFNFAHLGDLLPSPLQVLLSWIPNYLGKIILLVVGLAGLFNSVYTPIIYFPVRREYSRQTSSVS